jgi:hypothetical protein
MNKKTGKKLATQNGLPGVKALHAPRPKKGAGVH